MADEPKETEETEEEAPKKSKKGLFMIGGAAALTVVGYFGASMGVPAVETVPQFEGPFVISLNPEGESMQINLAETDATVYLLLQLSAEFDAYEAGDLESRMLDERYTTYLQDALLGLAGQKTRDTLATAEAKEAFKLEVRDAIDPILFPVHIGGAPDPLSADPASGVRPGVSMHNATLRGRYYDHTLTVDAPQQTVQLDDGEPIAYTGDEIDLAVPNASGSFVFLNVTMVEPGFVGELPIGVKGRTRRILYDSFITQ